MSTLEYPKSLEEYAVPEKDFYARNPQYQALVTGIVVFDNDGKLLLVQRAADEKAFPNLWEIPGGGVDEPDETILHAAARELKEEAGLEATRVVRKVGEFGWTSTNKKTGTEMRCLKLTFEMEVKSLDTVALDPAEHQAYLYATEGEVTADRVGEVALRYVSSPSKAIKLDAFRLRREGAPS
ncbi:hypothetical protein BS50DRAFT_572376 [Corynespora cassiicola Philippines]|uniref:Nudix hydrolase domain-containing protein n=1 Tax=Corynespora cassiicola Philippines TaxID=1448308 RepID=A0A2T2NUW4_CORCC|nr:hypothetical protein BS50DRAFT_572376 [Corynespora cassiicola Philippines]